MTSINDKFPPLARPFEALSFVAPSGSLWAPDRSGNYSEDCQLGRFYARELIGYIRLHSCPPLLGHVCQAMTGADWSGVEVGFFQQISEEATARTPVPTG